jgi:sterol desaturase/sphingolipid hydroxylase (fatty acid hydroxylase superfamily)
MEIKMSKIIAHRLSSISIYPLSWLILAAFYAATLNGYLAYQAAWGLLALTLIIFYGILERLLPFEKEWAMTYSSFKSDMKYILTNVTFILGLNALLGYFAISIAQQPNGLAAQMQIPLWAQFFLCLIIFEALNYSIHRAMHEWPGTFGKFLWRIHAAHHLPEKLYVVMHAVFHPINAVFVQVIAITVPIWIMGYDQKVVTLFLMINSLHGLISHFNVDVRMGWLNYVFVGTELHRYHHSADVDEGKNYGAMIPIFDILFGTFVYKPSKPPSSLGVLDEDMPRHADYLKVLALPFK